MYTSYKVKNEKFAVLPKKSQINYCQSFSNVHQWQQFSNIKAVHIFYTHPLITWGFLNFRGFHLRSQVKNVPKEVIFLKKETFLETVSYVTGIH